MGDSNELSEESDPEKNLEIFINGVCLNPSKIVSFFFFINFLENQHDGSK
jgi:hypothetical protein